MQSRTSQTGLIRKPLAWFFATVILLYILYSSHFILNNHQHCITQLDQHKQLLNNNNNASIHLDSEEEEEEQQQQQQEDQNESNSNTDDNVDDDQAQTIRTQTHNAVNLQNYDTELKHIVFGIAASAKIWEKRKEYVKVWWRPEETRGIVWMDQRVRISTNESLPEIKISEDTSKFKYRNRQGHRSAIRISRVVSEMLRLDLEDVRWFVMGDDDTVFVVENVVRILSKYDHNQFYYIGSSSESHLQNMYFSYAMAYGGGGFAISYPLALELAKMQDRCIQRYPGLYGSDDRIQACMAELGVPLTKETGFHQYDVYGDLLGLLASHPVTPSVSLHHLDVVDPIFPGMTQVQGLHHLFTSVNLDSASIFQQSICYDPKRQWSVTVSWGFVVQIYRGIMSPRELEMPARTFLNWYRRADYKAYAFNTRPVLKNPCGKPFVFYMNGSTYDEMRKQTVGVYHRHKTPSPHCRWKMDSPERINSVTVLKRPDPLRWFKSPRRDCCRVLQSNEPSTMYLSVGNCREGEVIELQKS